MTPSSQATKGGKASALRAAVLERISWFRCSLGLITIALWDVTSNLGALRGDIAEMEVQSERAKLPPRTALERSGATAGLPFDAPSPRRGF